MVPVRRGQRDKIKTGHRQIERGREGSLWKLFRENTKTFLNVMFGMILDSDDQMLAGMYSAA